MNVGKIHDSGLIIRISAQWLNQSKRLAEKQGITHSQMVRQLIIQNVTKNKK